MRKVRKFSEGDSVWVSGDFPSLACFEMERDAGTVGLFLAGCAGDIAPACAFQGIGRAREEGRRLAALVQAALCHLEPSDNVTLTASAALVHFPYIPLPSEPEVDLVAKKEERVVRPEEKRNAEIQNRIASALDEWSSTMRKVVQQTWPLTPVQCEIQALRIGPVTLLGISGEPFYEIGQRIRARSPSSALWPLGYTNAYCGYIPTAEEYPRGGYEVDDSWKYVGLWKLDASCEHRVLEAAINTLIEIENNPDRHAT